jgi:hypothetical protein
MSRLGRGIRPECLRVVPYHPAGAPEAAQLRVQRVGWPEGRDAGRRKYSAPKEGGFLRLISYSEKNGERQSDRFLPVIGPPRIE